MTISCRQVLPLTGEYLEELRRPKKKKILGFEVPEHLSPGSS